MSRSSPRRSPISLKSAGYTLTELLVVLFIMSLLTALALPAIKTTVPGIALTSTVATLEADLRQMRRQAISYSSSVNLSILDSGKAYEIEREGKKAKRRDLAGHVRIASANVPPVPEDQTNIFIIALPDGRFTGGDLRVHTKTRESVITFGTFGRRVHVTSR